MTRSSFDKSPDQGFSVGLPLAIITCCTLDVSVYLAVSGANIPPPSTKAYLASNAVGNP